jgi:hypothetical protein
LSTGMDLTDEFDLLVTISICVCVLLSVGASIIGARMGKRNLNEVNN